MVSQISHSLTNGLFKYCENFILYYWKFSISSTKMCGAFHSRTLLDPQIYPIIKNNTDKQSYNLFFQHPIIKSQRHHTPKRVDIFIRGVGNSLRSFFEGPSSRCSVKGPRKKDIKDERHLCRSKAIFRRYCRAQTHSANTAKGLSALEFLALF